MCEETINLPQSDQLRRRYEQNIYIFECQRFGWTVLNYSLLFTSLHLQTTDTDNEWTCSGDRELKLLFHDNSSKSLSAKMSIKMFEYNPIYTQIISIFMILDFVVLNLSTVRHSSHQAHSISPADRLNFVYPPWTVINIILNHWKQ